MKEVYIVGGGSSLKGFNFNKLKNKDTIVVNKALFSVPKSNYFITMDNAFYFKIEKRWRFFKKLKMSKIFVVNYDNNYIIEKDGKIIDTRWNIIYKLEDFNMIVKSYKSSGIGLSFSDFRNGINSGFCALQLAILLGYTCIYLLGIDMKITKQTHFHEGYSEDKIIFAHKLDKYCEYFKIGFKELHKKCPDIQVYSCSAISRLNDFIPYKELKL